MDNVNSYDIRSYSHRSPNILLELMGHRYSISNFLIGIFASNKVEKIKIKNDIETYDRILAFINGKDPKEVQKSKFRYIWTSLISFIFFVGVIIGISYLSIILTDYFL